MSAPAAQQADRIPGGVWMLGFVSMLMDISSEMVMTLLPVYLVTRLSAPASAVGMLEGLAVATAMVTRLFSGVLSDWTGNRKWLATAGYGLGALSRPVFPIAESVSWLVGARMLDRVGKGIRSAPRDALIADITPPHLRGASFGLRKSLDTVGGFAGPLIAIAVMYLTADNFQTVFQIAVIPAFLAVALLIFGVHEPDRNTAEKKQPFSLREAVYLNRAVWVAIAIASALTFARFSEAFLTLHSLRMGLDARWVPAIIVVMNLVYGLSAYPVGALSDRIGRPRVVFYGLIFLVAADLVLGQSRTIVHSFAGILLWGLHMGFTQGALSAMIADAAPARLRGVAFGVFNLVTGLVVLAGNVTAGVLWDTYGPSATFYMSAAVSAIGIIGLLLYWRARAVNA